MRSGSSDDAQARLLETALQLFASLGYDSTTTDMLADAAGVSHETVQKGRGAGPACTTRSWSMPTTS
ncbi:TetR/AcrR family transcriptional regulator [Actinomadura sp. SCN-SB]|uniref:TetR/AcrR family transcriptional regulator n=1 Tax=Actinomadura sp. SCN-SB TaxID=3373092 RepID=UPI0037502BAB